MALINGDNYVSGDLESFQQNNRLKNHWRNNVADLTNPQPGMIYSDPTDEKLYHRQAAAWQEILQANTPFGDNNQIIGGDNSDMILIPYEETTNDAIIWGIPVSPKRGLIVCDVADIAVNFTGLITAHAQPVFWFVDLDNDSYLGIGHQADDKPGIWSSGDLHIQYDANGDVIFFEDSGVGENRYAYYYGWKTGVGTKWGRLRINNLGRFEVDVEDEGAFLYAGNTILTWGSTGVSLVDDKIFYYGTNLDATQEYDETTNDAWIFGVPVNPKRGVIWCDVADIAVDFTGIINASAFMQHSFIDNDNDSYFQLGWAADDEPHILVGGAADTLKTNAIMEYTRQGFLFQWTYQGDLADDATFNLPAFTDACWGFIQAGNNEEYALFTVDDDGDVTLISNSANVVANADTDGNLVLGTAATQEPLVIRNRLGAQKNINLIIWYS